MNVIRGRRAAKHCEKGMKCNRIRSRWDTMLRVSDREVTRVRFTSTSTCS